MLIVLWWSWESAAEARAVMAVTSREEGDEEVDAAGGMEDKWVN